jgi:hypothetical protein
MVASGLLDAYFSVNSDEPHREQKVEHLAMPCCRRKHQ